jgi:DNA-binding response OmpR family regulator
MVDNSERSMVLVVDDDPWIRLLMRDLLTDEGYAVLEASNGSAALRLAERHPPAVVLLDLVLPEQSGLELLTVLKSTPATAHVPVIVVTARSDLLARATELADGVVAKPFDVEELLAKIGGTLQRSSPRAEASMSIASASTCQHGPNRGAHYALKEAPSYTAAEQNPLLNVAQKYHLGEETLAEIDDQHRALASGTFLRKAQFGGSALTVMDPSQAPKGFHTAYAWQPVPPVKAGEVADIDKEAEEHAWRVIDTWAEYAPNMTRANVLATYVYNPSRYVQEFPNMVGGDIFMGAFTGAQVMDNHFGYRSEIPGLYMGGSSVHPGGAISGGPGYICAGLLAEDLGFNRWWPTIDLEPHAEALRHASRVAAGA